MFWDQSLLEKTPPTAFLRFYPIFSQFFQLKKYFIIFEEFRQLCAIFHKFAMKISGEIICQSWLLFTPFFNFPIVQCCMLGTWKNCGTVQTQDLVLDPCRHVSEHWDHSHHSAHLGLGDHLRTSPGACLWQHLGHGLGMSGVSSGASSGACLGQSKLSAVIHASLMPFFNRKHL